MAGYTGKILKVDLSRRKIKEEELNISWAEKFVGGRGLGMAYMTQFEFEKIEPLSPENPLMLFTGPLTATKTPTSGRLCAVFISPLTDLISYSNSGGIFGAKLKRAGYDGLIITGKSEKPVYLAIFDGEASIEDAKEIWGKTVSETERWLKKEHGKNVNCASIGIAGERAVPISTIMVDRISAFGRTGAGAVMGSKNLKAIAVAGRKEIEIYNEEDFSQSVKKAFSLLKENPITGEALKSFGTCALVHVINTSGVFPVRNFQENYWDFDRAEAISGEYINENLKKRSVACYNCPIACKQILEVDGNLVKGPEFETAWAFGADMDNSDLLSIVKIQEMCNEFGIDPISLGSSIACLMELNEKADVKDFKISWGDMAKVIQLVEKTGKADGFGLVIGKGAKHLAEYFGQPDLAMHAKGLELPAYDPRGLQGMGLSYATSNRGGCHLAGYTIPLEIFNIPQPVDRYKPNGKAMWVKYKQDMGAFVDSLVVCKFATFAIGPDVLADLLSHSTGFNFDSERLFLAGERIYNLERVMNIRRKGELKDTLPKRLLNEGSNRGPSKGRVVKLDSMLKEYYKLRGWDKEGKPTKGKLSELEIEVELQ